MIAFPQSVIPGSQLHKEKQEHEHLEEKKASLPGKAVEPGGWGMQKKRGYIGGERPGGCTQAVRLRQLGSKNHCRLSNFLNRLSQILSCRKKNEAEEKGQAAKTNKGH